MDKKINKSHLLAALTCGTLFCTKLAIAAEIDTNMAQMQAMDKITGKVSVINVPVNGSVDFGSFSILVRACKTRSPEDTPENFAFVDVTDSYHNQTPVNIFRGWMISSSPALNPIEHPIYDVWLLKCIDGKVNPSQLLSKEELAARDALPKAEPLDESAKLKSQDDSSQIHESSSADKDLMVEPETKVEEAKETAIIEEKVLENHSVANPPVILPNEPIIEPEIHEDGAPKSLLNIGNDVAPESSDNQETTDSLIEGNLATPEQLNEADSSKPQNSEKNSGGFLEKFLSLDNEEEQLATDANASPVQAEENSIDVNEIDKELNLLQ